MGAVRAESRDWEKTMETCTLAWQQGGRPGVMGPKLGPRPSPGGWAVGG